MKNYVGNGYYFVNHLNCFSINKKDTRKKSCLNNGKCISNKEHLKRLFIETLRNDLSEKNINYFFCVTHDSFIDLIEHTSFEIKAKIPISRKANIKELFPYWKCDSCEECNHKKTCYVYNGVLPDINRNEYLLLFVRRNNK